MNTMEVLVAGVVEFRPFTEEKVGKAHIWDERTQYHKEPVPIYRKVPEHDPGKEIVRYPVAGRPEIHPRKVPGEIPS